MQRAERDLARARLTAAAADPAAGPAFAAAITGLRQHSTPYHLAHGLLDHAAHLAARGDAEAAAAAAGEAAGIAARLGCQPLLDRAETTGPPGRAPRPRDNRICRSTRRITSPGPPRKAISSWTPAIGRSAGGACPAAATAASGCTLVAASRRRAAAMAAALARASGS